MQTSFSDEKAALLRALGAASTELFYAAAELRNAASRDDLDSRAVLYNLADSLERAARRVHEVRSQSEQEGEEDGG